MAGGIEKEVIGDCTLHCGDSLDLLDSFFGIDALITDPPYGIDLARMCGTYRDRWVQSAGEYLVAGDDRPFDPRPFLRFPKMIIWGGNHFASKLPDTRCWLVWDKREGTTPDNQADCELAWTNLPGPARMHRQLWRGVCRRGEENISHGQKRVHPTQKPVALMDWCLNLAGSPQVVLDPFMGSGTTGVVCARRGLQFIGVEIERRHFDTACRRIEEAYQQGDLLVAAGASSGQKLR